jgi:muramoyltetrapeptide carboxypeptidase LdcA involved in peptidoglycan recycling
LENNASRSHEKPLKTQEKARFRQEQEEAIHRALREYNAEIMVVFNLDFGHTDPQYIIPNGGKIRIDGVQKKIFVTY